MVLPTWWKDGVRLNDSAFAKTENNSLIIHNTTTDDRGIYRCETVQVYEDSEMKGKLTFKVTVGGKYFIYSVMKIRLHLGVCSCLLWDEIIFL